MWHMTLWSLIKGTNCDVAHGTVTFDNRYEHFGGTFRLHIKGGILMETTRFSETLVPNCTALHTRRQESSHSPIMIRKPRFSGVFKREPNFYCFMYFYFAYFLLQWDVAYGSSVYLLCWCLISRYSAYSWKPKAIWFWWMCKLESFQNSSGLIHCYVWSECAIHMDFESCWK
jgi:hypothetical protein